MPRSSPVNAATEEGINVDCSICRQSLIPPSLLVMCYQLHLHHLRCFEEYTKDHRGCPSCPGGNRTNTRERQRRVSLDSIVSKLEMEVDELRNKRAKLKEEIVSLEAETKALKKTNDRISEKSCLTGEKT